MTHMRVLLALIPPVFAFRNYDSKSQLIASPTNSQASKICPKHVNQEFYGGYVLEICPTPLSNGAEGVVFEGYYKCVTSKRNPVVQTDPACQHQLGDDKFRKVAVKFSKEHIQDDTMTMEIENVQFLSQVSPKYHPLFYKQLTEIPAELAREVETKQYDITGRTHATEISRIKPPGLVMEFINGKTLAEELAENSNNNDLPSCFLAQMAEALFDVLRVHKVNRDLHFRNAMTMEHTQPYIVGDTTCKGIKLIDLGRVADVVPYYSPQDPPGFLKLDMKDAIFNILFELIVLPVESLYPRPLVFKAAFIDLLLEKLNQYTSESKAALLNLKIFINSDKRYSFFAPIILPLLDSIDTRLNLPPPPPVILPAPVSHQKWHL